MQASLFGESLGEGYCQHPTHFDELTTQVVEAKAASLKDTYQVIKVVRKEDGFQPLHLAADGDLGVGAQQYESCKGCESFVGVPEGPTAEKIDNWNEAFFGSFFTHPNVRKNLVKYRGGAYKLWTDMLDGKFAHFPERVLVPVKATLGQLLDGTAQRND